MVVLALSCVGREGGRLQVTCRCGDGAVDLSGPARRRRSASTVTYRIPAEQAAKPLPAFRPRLDGCPSRREGFFVSPMQTSERCRSATTTKMSSFFFFSFLLPRSLMPQTDGVERGMERTVRETHKGAGATPGYILAHHKSVSCTFIHTSPSSCPDTGGSCVFTRPPSKKVSTVKL